ncbi:MAG: hypothetical protein HYX40_04150 [Sphingobacteriales bacterium]|nr:hypothetical protein [Sphingobacteriales bacterium]
MKTILLTLALLIAINSIGQTDNKKILETLSSFKDQYDHSFSSTISDSLVIIYISGWKTR